MTENILCQVHHTFQPAQGDLWRCTHTRESQVQIQMFLRGLFPRERIFTEHRLIRDFLELQAGHAAQRKQAALSKLSEVEHHTRLLLEEQKNHLLPEARSEMSMQVFKTGHSLKQAHRFILNAWNSTRRTSHLIIPEEKRLALHRIEGKRKSSSRNSCENSPRNGRIEEDLLYRS